VVLITLRAGALPAHGIGGPWRRGPARLRCLPDPENMEALRGV